MEHPSSFLPISSSFTDADYDWTGSPTSGTTTNDEEDSNLLTRNLTDHDYANICGESGFGISTNSAVLNEHDYLPTPAVENVPSSPSRILLNDHDYLSTEQSDEPAEHFHISINEPNDGSDEENPDEEGSNDHRDSGSFAADSKGAAPDPLSFVQFGEKVVVDVAPRFGLTGEAYYFHFTDIDKITDVEGVVSAAFQHILDQAKDDAKPTDKIGVSISHPSLDKEALVHFRSPDNCSVEEILNVIEKIQMSKKELNFDEMMNVKVTKIHPPSGEGKYVKMNNADWYRWYHQYTGGHGSNFIQIKNSDNMCLARSIAVTRARIQKETDPNVKWKQIYRGAEYRYSEQHRLALELTSKAGLLGYKGPCGPMEFQKFQQILVKEGFQLKIFSKAHFNARVFDDKHPDLIYLYILHHDNHFTPMKSPCPITGTKFYCDHCNKGYDKIELHKCDSICPCCKKPGRCVKAAMTRCNDCNRHFFGTECYNQHLSEVVKETVHINEVKRRKVAKKSICQLLKRCTFCSKTVRSCNMASEKHHCGENYCKFCKIWHREKHQHQCYIQPILTGGFDSEGDENDLLPEERENDPDSIDTLIREHEENDGVTEEERINHFRQGKKGGKKVAKFIFFDFETTQSTLAGNNKFGPVYLHKPNCCIARKACEKCKDFWLKKCNNCNNRSCEFCRSESPNCDTCKQSRTIFVGPDCKQEFCKWLFQDEHKGSVVLAHNAKGFDGHFILQYLAGIPYMPKVIPRGLEILCIMAFDIKIIDSLSFLPMSLASLPKAFGESEMKKGYFPYLFVTENNLNYRGDWPDSSYYDPDHMKPEQRETFYEWYKKQEGKIFDMKRELLEYCNSDCDILLRCCLKFRDLFMSETGVDPLSVSITIASACNYVFRKKYLKPNTIGLIPYGGYRRKERQSVVALQWLKWVSNNLNIEIHHARNGREKHVGQYKLDGFDGQNGYEFYGCVYHGCPRCQKNRSQKVPGSDLTMEDVYQRTLERAEYIRRQGVNLIEMWECQFYEEFKKNKEMRDFIEGLETPLPLDPRNAFAGGRCNGAKLYHKCKNGEKISYIDICSLYPWVCKYGIFPTKHPEIITENFPEFQKYEKLPWLGLIHCRVLPPRGLLHPVLPYHCRDRLMFPLCRTCTETESRTLCNCSSEQRALTGTWVSLELDKAIELGYRIEKIYEVWNYKDFDVYDGADDSTGLFTKYINCFLKLKAQASGWPSYVKTQEDRDRFIAGYQRREGVKLDPSKMKKNAGLRSIAKLMLNSFWGKFGQRCNMNQLEFINEPSKFFSLVWDSSNVVSQIRSFGQDNVAVSYKKSDDFADILPNTNVAIAAFTTAQARLKLYDYLEELQDRVLYYDTDSVIYLTRQDDTYEPSLGSYLGQMTNELEDFGPGAYISEFVTGGPKTYGYKVQKADGDSVTKIKVKGFTLNYEAATYINFERMKQQVNHFVKFDVYDEVSVVQPQIRRASNHNIVSITQKKINKVTYKKRAVRKDFSTIPYGY